MQAVHLFIDSDSLRGAVTEQMTGANLAFYPINDSEALALTLQKEGTLTLLCDEAALNPKVKDILRGASPNKMRLFLIGEGDKAGDEIDALITETFPKPVRLGHLLARLQFTMNNNARTKSAPVEFGPYRFEAQNRQLIKLDDQKTIRLTEKETALLDQLAQSDAPLSRDDLLAAIWGYGAQIDTHTLETHIYQLRRKLDPDHKGQNWLVNEQGAYRLRRSESEKD